MDESPKTLSPKDYEDLLRKAEYAAHMKPLYAAKRRALFIGWHNDELKKLRKRLPLKMQLRYAAAPRALATAFWR